MNPDPREEPVDQLAAMRAELDQAIAMAPELARTARGYFDAFVGQGFTGNQALYLTAVQLQSSPGDAPS
jgi:hypothetical protein